MVRAFGWTLMIHTKLEVVPLEGEADGGERSWECRCPFEPPELIIL